MCCPEWRWEDYTLWIHAQGAVLGAEDGALCNQICGKIRAVGFLRPALRGTAFVPKDIMIEPEDLPETDDSQVTQIPQAEVKDVHAESVRMDQADAETISASEVAMHQSAAGNVKATHVSARQSALASVVATEVLAEQAALGYVQAEKASISGYTGAVVARIADVHQGVTGFVIANDVHVSESRTILLVGRNVQGNVTTLMDTRSALIAGLLGGLFASITLLLGRMLFGRR